MLVTDTAGSTLEGAIDGTNVLYRTSLDYDPDSVQVYLNGRLKVASLDDGYTVLGLRQIAMKEPPLPGDTVSASYQLAGEASLGGAPDVGQSVVMAKTCPDAPIVRAKACELAPPRVRARASRTCT